MVLSEMVVCAVINHVRDNPFCDGCLCNDHFRDDSFCDGRLCDDSSCCKSNNWHIDIFCDDHFRDGYFLAVIDMSGITISCEKGWQFVWKDNRLMCRRIKRFSF